MSARFKKKFSENDKRYKILISARFFKYSQILQNKRHKSVLYQRGINVPVGNTRLEFAFITVSTEKISDCQIILLLISRWSGLPVCNVILILTLLVLLLVVYFISHLAILQ